MKIRILCVALLILPAIAMAGSETSVNTKNGNFYTTYTDIQQRSDAKSGGHVLELTRSYNSKSSGVGWFGFGWGTLFEARIIVMPDGSVVVQENGRSGQENYYPPKAPSNLQAGVDKIVAEAIQQDKLDSEAAEVLRAKLLADENLRRTKVAKYGIQSQLPEGGIVQLSDCNAITRLNDEYRRTSCRGGTDYFDLSGRLIRKEDGNYKTTIHYVEKYPDSIEDSLGQKMLLKWTAAGHIAEARTDKPAPIKLYTYDEKDNLLLANEISGIYYKYAYDSNHNLTRIGYMDGTHMDMQYDEKSLISSVVETDGSKANYTYRLDPNNPLSHYWTTTTWTSTTGEQSSHEDEFLLATDAVGVEQLAGLTRTEGQRKQGIVLDERGRVKNIQKTNGGFAEYFYHPTLNKISAVVTDKMSTVFKYNKAGDMVLAYNTQDQLIKVDYNRNKLVNRIKETNKTEGTRRELTFKYSSLGKPINIKMVGKGEINVEYDEQGEIVKVESKQGAAIALAVTVAMQTLLSVVKAGGVDLRM